MANKPKILYVAMTLPIPGSGANNAIYRHLVQHDDFDVEVVTDKPCDMVSLPCEAVTRPSWLDRVKSTRFVRLIHNAELLAAGWRIPARVDALVQRFRPDCVLTIPDPTISWMAYKISRKYNLPLITNFQDWWPRGLFYYPFEEPYLFVRDRLEKRFWRMFQQSSLVFCTSPGMQEHLGSPPNSAVLYPIPERTGKPEPTPPADSPSTEFKLYYTGSCFGAYGKMLLELYRRLQDFEGIRLVIFGRKPDWPQETLEQAKADGTYRGFLPYAVLHRELKEADAFLAVMTFDPRLETMMRTSFTTKVLDYSKFSRPILFWGPSFASPYRVLEEKRAGILVGEESAEPVVAALRQLISDPIEYRRLSQAGRHLAETEFDHDTIHALFRSRIQSLLERTVP